MPPVKLSMQSADDALLKLHELTTLFPELITESVDADGNTVKCLDVGELKSMLSSVIKIKDDDELIAINDSLEPNMSKAQQSASKSRSKVDVNSLDALLDIEDEADSEEQKRKMQEQKEALLKAKAQERYGFTWPGKSEAKRLASSSSNNTLRPDVDESVDFNYAKNLYIEGDNLEVLKLLREPYLNSISVIYIDPPYNTGKDFIYKDDFAMNVKEYNELQAAVDEQGQRLVANTSSNGRIHSDWCSMMYSRLIIAQQLLKKDGFILVSIDDNEMRNMRNLLDEVFGEQNFIANFIWKKKQGGGNDKDNVVLDHEYILVYAKDKRNVFFSSDKDAPINLNNYPFEDERGRYGLVTLDKNTISYSESLNYEIIGPDGTSYRPRVINGVQSCWRWSKAKVERDYDSLVFKNGNVYTKFYSDGYRKHRSLLTASRFGRTSTGRKDIKLVFDKDVFSYPKPVRLIKYLLSLHPDNDILVLDFFSGSATTAQAVMELNALDGGKRRFILIQLPENVSNKKEAVNEGFSTICDIGKNRIRKVAKLIEDGVLPTVNDVDKADAEEAKDSDIDALNDDGADLDDTFIEDIDVEDDATRVKGKKSAKEAKTASSGKASSRDSAAKSAKSISHDVKPQLNESAEVADESYSAYGRKISKSQSQDDDAAHANADKGEAYAFIKQEDLGFRVLRLDSSNMLNTYYTPSSYTLSMLIEDHVKSDRSSLDVLFQCMLNLGVPLNSTIRPYDMGDDSTEAYIVGNKVILAVLTGTLTLESLRTLVKEQATFLVVREDVINEDAIKDNLDNILKEESPSTKVLYF